jgi:hypothetical protein
VNAKQWAAAIGGVLLSCELSAAAEVFTNGHTNGAIGNNTLTNTPYNQSSTLGGLTYNNCTNFAGPTGLAEPAGTFTFDGVPGGVDTLGTLQLSPSVTPSFTNVAFSLLIAFNAPTGIVGGQNVFYSGTINSFTTGNGGVRLDFDNTPRHFLFRTTGAQPAEGSFDLIVDDLTVNRYESPRAITGRIVNATQTAVPEPTTFAALGLAALALCRRRRSPSA